MIYKNLKKKSMKQVQKGSKCITNFMVILQFKVRTKLYFFKNCDFPLFHVDCMLWLYDWQPVKFFKQLNDQQSDTFLKI